MAEVLVDIPAPGLDRIWHYEVPPRLAGRVRVGQRVLVPLGRRRVEGYLVGFAPASPVHPLKPLLAVRDDETPVDGDRLALAQWLADRYLCLRVEALRCLVPPGTAGAARTKPKLVQGYTLAVDADEARAAAVELAEAAPRQAAIVAELLQAAVGAQPGPVAAAELRRRTGAPESSFKALVRRGLIAPAPVRIDRRPPAPRVAEPKRPLSLTDEQRAALAVIAESRRQPDPRPVVLHGVTGSGKTEIYLRAIADTLAEGKGAIVLVPEIALTPQTFARFAARFPGQVALLHSGLGFGERFDQWEKVASGQAPIVVGARSAVFAPVRRLGLIVVDEEHEPSYKQEESPRYHSRDVAVERARRAGALCILGSATPSLETFVRAMNGEYRVVRLRRRIDQKPMPAVEVVDMRAEMLAGNRGMFSARLKEALAQCLERGQQAVLFLNRRGFAQFLLCRECGLVVRCEQCAVSYTYHAEPIPHLRCHYCNDWRPLPRSCPQCGGPHVRPFGTGTQRVEAAVQELFPQARVQRFDTDTAARKGAHTAFFEAVRRGDVDVIVGTQMIAKGLDFPNVTLVGVVAADLSLHVPDFRSAERTFQLLMQVGGRAGRGEHPGRVIVQTYAPDHYSIVAARDYDEDGFYRREAVYRQSGGYPPFLSLVRVLVSAAQGAEEAARRVAEAARTYAGRSAADVFGPAPAPLARLRGKERWHVLIKGPGDIPRQVAAAAQESWRRSLAGRDVAVAVDVDPLSLI